MVLTAAIRTARLELRPVTRADGVAMREGDRQDWWHPDYPREDDVDGASMVQSDDDPWGSWHVLSDGLAVGTVGFFGPPDVADDGVAEAEIGYGLVAAARGGGLATEAVAALLAGADAAGVRVRASVEPGNTSSVRVLVKSGFTALRGTDDEGQLVMVRPLPAS